jgi:predicted nuclease of predicted toxin-antitoxin system
MTLLFDQNISYRVCKGLNKLHPKAAHVADVGLKNASDIEIWKYASQNSCCIVTFDSDFGNLATLYGSPQKVIWFRTGNKSTSDIIKIFQANHHPIQDFLSNPALNMMVF